VASVGRVRTEGETTDPDNDTHADDNERREPRKSSRPLFLSKETCHGNFFRPKVLPLQQPQKIKRSITKTQYRNLVLKPQIVPSPITGTNITQRIWLYQRARTGHLLPFTDSPRSLIAVYVIKDPNQQCVVSGIHQLPVQAKHSLVALAAAHTLCRVSAGGHKLALVICAEGLKTRPSSHNWGLPGLAAVDVKLTPFGSRRL